MLNGLIVKTYDSSEPVSVEDRNRSYRVQQRIDVPLGATSIRPAMRDISTARIGAMEVDLPLAPETQTRAKIQAQP
jgi:hypothetical protein